MISPSKNKHVNENINNNNSDIYWSFECYFPTEIIQNQSDKQTVNMSPLKYETVICKLLQFYNGAAFSSPKCYVFAIDVYTHFKKNHIQKHKLQRIYAKNK